MNGNTQKLPPGADILLKAMLDDFFPLEKKINSCLVEIQKIRIPYYFLFSKKLNDLTVKYENLSAEYFSLVNVINNPDLLFENFKDKNKGVPDYMIGYMQFKPGIQNNINQVNINLEIIDRTLDRKHQNLQNKITLFLAVFSIVLGVFSLFINIRYDK